MPERPAVTSSELGVLWLTYQQKTMILRMLEYFIARADDEKAAGIMKGLYGEAHPYAERMKEIFQEEGAAVPIGFTVQDVEQNAPKLYDNGFDIMFIRLMKEISMGMHALNITMVYREDLILLFKDLTAITQKYYALCSGYLLEKGILARPPYIAMPQSVEFAESTRYLSGNPIADLFHEKRTLNTVELAHIYHSIEANIIGKQLIMGFAQVAQEEEARSFFREGAKLAESIIEELRHVLQKSGVQSPESSVGNLTLSTDAPFSDKLMMYCISLFCSFSMGGNSLGTAFSLRNDLPAKMTVFMKDIFEYAHKGAKIMIRHGWMEEPLQLEKPE
ncbi:DUF3231 family protein [Ectobacillus ponti]|uniref:DUF3231 family protein n=1 Tax=Ectobacillus ponti TaxID=2961894 RepID=A0AA41X547_9BACI|nr:DUF3231 family protein [Ectobacillus ponti]MCP8969096.1 DUF3231 family protein [Ectobacillus ponti]